MATFKGIEDLVTGNEYLFYICNSAYTVQNPIAYSTNASIDISATEIEANNKFSCRWVDKLAGNASYTVQCDSLYTQVSGLTSFDTLMGYMANGDTVYWALGIEQAAASCAESQHQLDTTKRYYKGKGVITSLNLGANVDEVCSCSCTISGAGQIQSVN